MMVFGLFEKNDILNRYSIIFFGVFVLGILIPIQESWQEINTENPGIIMKFCANRPIYNIDPYTINPHEILAKCVEAYEGYSPTNRIFVLIYAPSWNTDSDKLDVIGNTVEHPISVYTTENSKKLVGTDTDFIAGFGECTGFKEMGPDTGLFAGKVALTGFKKDYNGDGIPDAFGATNCGVASSYGDDVNVVKIKTKQEGAFTLAWETFDGFTISKSAEYSFREAQIQFEKNQYTVNDEVSIILRDLDYQITPGDENPLIVKVWSDSDVGGIEVKNFWKREPKIPIYFDDSYFSKITLTDSKESLDDGRLRVSEGDSIYVEFDDYTLPRPYSNEDFKKIQNVSKIFFVENNRHGIEIDSFIVTDLKNRKKHFFETGDIMFNLKIDNITSKFKPVSAIFLIKDEKGMVQDVFWNNMNLQPEKVNEINLSWKAEKPGKFNAEVYVWKNILDGNPLLEPKKIEFEILD